MSRILFATDLSPYADRALDRAAMLAASRGSTLVVLNVVSDELMSGPAGEAASQAALAALRDYVAEAALPESLVVEPMVRRGEPGAGIVQAAHETDSELVVLGGAHADMLVQLFRRSLMRHVVRHAPCPVLVVHRRARRDYRRVLVASDLSLPSRRALEFALHFLPGTEMTVVHAGHSAKPPLGADDVKLQLDDMLTASLTRLTAEGRPAPAAITSVHEVGSARTVIPEVAARLSADVAVLGTLGLTGAASLLLGSTAEGLLTALTCDVLVVRPQER